MRVLASVIAFAFTACTTVPHVAPKADKPKTVSVAKHDARQKYPAFNAYHADFVLRNSRSYKPEVKPAEEKPKTDSTHTTFVSYIKSANVKIDRRSADGLARRITRYAKEFNIDPFLYLALVQHESTFYPKLVSPAGAKGYAQVIPRYHEEKIAVAKKRFGTSDIFNPDVNLYVGAWVLREYIDRSKGSLTNGLLRYNGSLTDSSKKYAKVVMNYRQQAHSFHREKAVDSFFAYYS